MGRISGGLHGFQVANTLVDWAIGTAVAFLCAIERAEFQGIDPQFLGQFIDDRF